MTRRFGLLVFALNDNGSETPVPHPAGSMPLDPYDLGDVPFPANQPAVSWPFPIRNLMLPRRGRYEFRLLVRRQQPTWRGEWWTHVASHHIVVE
ncbi:MAG: hypothetical protein K8U57_38260 [Planctomycetes bacterium]|nr:hypothetical protein [Planctomycetota bacterium]